MNVLQTLLCSFLLSLQVGAGDAVVHYYKVLGEDLHMKFSFGRLYGEQTIFCRENCEGENLLIETNQQTAENGRYKTEFFEKGHEDFNPGYPGLSVFILNLTKSDSGLYKCGLGNSSSSARFIQFGVFVADALLDGNNVSQLTKAAGSSLTVACSFKTSGNTKSLCRGECEENNILLQIQGETGQNHRYLIEYNENRFPRIHLHVSIKQLEESDSGTYRCYLDQSYREFNLTVESSGTAGPSGQQNTSGGTCGGTSGGTCNHNVPLIVGLTLGVTVVLLSAALLVSCRRRSVEGPRTRRSPHGPNMEELDYENCTPQDQTYQSLSPATTDQNQIYSTLKGTH